MASFAPLSSPTGYFRSIAVDTSTNDVYAVTADTGPSFGNIPSKLFKRTGGVGDFVNQSLSGMPTFTKCVAVDSTTHDVFILDENGTDSKKWVGGTGSLVSYPMNLDFAEIGIAVDSSNQNVLLLTSHSGGASVWKQAGGVGSFVDIWDFTFDFTKGNYMGIAVDPSTHNVYVTIYNDDIYKQTGGTGDFVALGQTVRNWSPIAIDESTSDVYAGVFGGNIYKQTGGTGDFVSFATGIGNINGLCVDGGIDVLYGTVELIAGQIYVYPVPGVDFVGTPLTGTNPLSVQFTDLTTESPISWLWDFGDGQTSTEQNPEHLYQNSGTYSVTLNATNRALGASLLKTDYILVTDRNLYLQNVFIVGSDTRGTVQMLNVGKADDGQTIYYELETQELEFGNRGSLKKIANQIGVLSRDGLDSNFEVKSDSQGYSPIPLDMTTRVSIGNDINTEGHFFTFKWFGQVDQSSPVLEGFYLENVTDLGVTQS